MRRRLASWLLASFAVMAPPASASEWREAPIVPRLGPEMEGRLEALADRAALTGRRPGVFAKIGDSITASPAFLSEMACRPPRWGRWPRLRSTWSFFRDTLAPGGGDEGCLANSYSRESTVAKRGWTAADALRPLPEPPPGCGEAPSALACELRLLQPSVALVMFGTNDLKRSSLRSFRASLAAMVRHTLASGTIPVLSTIPPRARPPMLSGRVAAFNAEIYLLARRLRVPLWNYWRQMVVPGVLALGLRADGVHPSRPCARCSSADFRPPALRFGFPLRNLGAMLALERIRHRVLAD